MTSSRTTHEEPTTPDLVELARRWVEAASYDEWAAFAERHLATDAVRDAGPALGLSEGLAAILASLEEYWLMWDEHHHYVDEVVDLGHGVLYLVVREDGRIKGSDAVVEARNAWVNTWDGGKIVRMTMYTDIDEGRAAAERLADERG